MFLSITKTGAPVEPLDSEKQIHNLPSEDILREMLEVHSEDINLNIREFKSWTEEDEHRILNFFYYVAQREERNTMVQLMLAIAFTGDYFKVMADLADQWTILKTELMIHRHWPSFSELKSTL